MRARALALAAAHDALSGAGAARGGDDGALMLAVAAIVVEHDPVVRLAEPVRLRGVGEERGVVATAAPRVEPRRYSLACWRCLR